MKKLVPALILMVNCAGLAWSQDTLPKFVAKNVGNNRIVISWTNTFQNIRQISIQRSTDSLINYKTILTVLDPSLPQNGYVDTKANTDRMFYRLYIMLDKGVYMFSNTKRPFKDSTIKTEPVTIVPPVKSTDSARSSVGDSLSIPITESPIRNKIQPFAPSPYVHTLKDGYVQIILPDANTASSAKGEKKYSIKFFEQDNTFLFELKEIKNKNFKLDKTNFYHAGWFNFELYEDGKLLERHKFYLAKEF